MTDARLVYVTASDADEAQRIADVVVAERLAACANSLGDVTSTFFWQGAVQHGAECALVLKTAQDRLDALVDHIVALHSYDEPCIVALPIVGGSAGFIAWILEETREASPISTPPSASA